MSFVVPIAGAPLPPRLTPPTPILQVCVTIVGTYFLLNAENYHWHWTAFSAGASTCELWGRPGRAAWAQWASLLGTASRRHSALSLRVG